MGAIYRYEIFRKFPSREASWVENAANLDDALGRLKELNRILPADYFILDRDTSTFIIPRDTVGDN